MNDEIKTNGEENEMSNATETAAEPKSSNKKSTSKKKSSAKGAAKKSKGTGAVKRAGVISFILSLLCRAEGTSAAEAVKELKKKFPDRDEKGMETTFRIQVTRLPQRYGFELKKSKDEKRGLVYKAPASVLKQATRETEAA